MHTEGEGCIFNYVNATKLITYINITCMYIRHLQNRFEGIFYDLRRQMNIGPPPENSGVGLGGGVGIVAARYKTSYQKGL